MKKNAGGMKKSIGAWILIAIVLLSLAYMFYQQYKLNSVISTISTKQTNRTSMPRTTGGNATTSVITGGLTSTGQE